MVATGGAAAARARLRRVRRDRRDRVRHPVPRRARLAALPRARAAAAGRRSSAILVAAPYRLQRLTAFLDPWSDPFGKGYQLSHSLIAFGRGEWFGVGLGVERREAPLPARGAHRLPARGDRRGAGLRRRRRRSSRSSSGCCTARTRSAARRRASSGRSRRWSRRASASGSACRRSSTSASTWACCRPRASRCRCCRSAASGIVANCVALAILLRVDYENRRLAAGLHGMTRERSGAMRRRAARLRRLAE